MTESPLRPFRPHPDELRETERLVDARLLRRIVLDVVAPPSLPDGRELRAEALRQLLPGRLIASHAAVCEESAAWLWCGGDPPDEVTVTVRPRTSRAGASYLRLRERRIPPEDVVAVRCLAPGTLPVTTGVRTVADLLRAAPEDVASTRARRVFTRLGVELPDVVSCLDAMPRARGVARARALLAAWPESGRPAAGRPPSDRPAAVAVGPEVTASPG